MKPPTELIDVEWKTESEREFRVGDVFRLRFHRHGSVGEDAEVEVSDTEVISHEQTETKYLHPERMKPGWSGGDAERGYWTFKAKKPGTATITVRVLFRFEVESEHQVEITVVE
ncbi:MAG: hypothetical protein BAJATHORv1_10513 [Candidatus Thorarchaeota archaeon]|nr:MAG: hypothetical protein BAJATHORv1_10513 [Candidatus Thorarchaeota archaeon]